MAEIDHDAATRKAFEAWISAPPYEKETHRQGQSNTWPGQYHAYDVQLAWQAWRKSVADLAERAKHMEEIVKAAEWNMQVYIDLSERAKAAEELHRMQLVAISVVSLTNTRESMEQQRIGRDNPHWTVAYDDVCKTVEREMVLIERAKRLEEERANEQLLLEDGWHHSVEGDDRFSVVVPYHVWWKRKKDVKEIDRVMSYNRAEAARLACAALASKDKP